MKTLRTLALTGLLALPIHSFAQTSNAPGGSASTGTPLDETKAKPQTSKHTSTSPSVTNPSGTLSKDAKPKPAPTTPTTEPASTKDTAPTK